MVIPFPCECEFLTSSLYSMLIVFRTNNVNCPTAACDVDLGPICPSQLVGPLDSTGFPIGCKSACLANLDGDPSMFTYSGVIRDSLRCYSPPGDSPNCCTGSHNTAATCPPSGVDYYSFFSMSRSFEILRISLLIADDRGELSWCLCLCVWRIFGNCVMDVRFEFECGLYYHILPLILIFVDLCSLVHDPNGLP